jgi:D-alanyl-D-alanine carboxypeptidase
LRPEPAVAVTLTPTQVAAGSTEPIRPVLVKTLTVKAGVRTASLAASHVALPAAEAQPIAAAAPAPAPMVAAKAEPAVLPPAPIAAEPSAPPPAPAPAPAPVAAAKPEPAAAPPEVATKPEPPTAPAAPATAAKEEPAPMAAVTAAAAKPEAAAEPAPAHPGMSSAAPAPVAAAPAVPTPKPAPAAQIAAATPTAKPAPAAPAAKPQHRPGWMIQVGAFPAEQAAQQRLSTVQGKASKMLSGTEAFTETVDKAGTTYYRARFAGLDKDKAEAACKYLKKNDVECVTIKN